MGILFVAESFAATVIDLAQSVMTVGNKPVNQPPTPKVVFVIASIFIGFFHTPLLFDDGFIGNFERWGADVVICLE